MCTESVPVLIAGAGPVGLATAVFLSRHGVRPLLVERRPGTSVLPRAPGIQARTMEIFRAAGLEPAIRALEMDDSLAYFEGGILRTRTLAEIAGAQVIEAPTLYGDAISPVTAMGCGQDRYETVLLAAARERGAEARFGTRLVAFEQDEDGVLATLRTEDGERQVRARYLVGADGSRSDVRAALGLRTEGRGAVFNALSIYFRAPELDALMGGRRFILCYTTASATPVALSRLHGCDPWVAAAIYDPEAGESAADFTRERCVALIQEVSGRPGLEVEVVDTIPWEGAQRIAERFGAGRVFLAGDAAHVHPPAGGFGANTGIHDAHNLAWKLAAVLNGWAGPGLLDTYDAERRPLGAAMAEQAMVRFRARHGQAAPGDRLVDDIIVTLGYRYASTAVPGGTGTDPLPPRLTLDGEPGTRAPHVWLRRGERPSSTLDLFFDGFVLLTAPGGEAWADAAAGHAARVPEVPLRAVPVTADVAAAYGVGQGGAALVRPDAFVAWRSAGPAEDPQAVLSEIMARTLSRVSYDQPGLASQPVHL
ncbi:FAD-dependent monooxygenase [Sphaerisporangium dianthi]|uniref:FAD-dependent monooxygenase n=1 Tax=Sphaerisporangium dianthi TaxID=1436120 RepID=A0ABV9CLI1_9ACTN